MSLQSSQFKITRRSFLAAGLFLVVPAFADPISRVPVESSNLKSVGFDSKTKTLEVEFRHGGVYRYLEVPDAVHAELMKAESKGRYFQTNVRNKFRFERTPARK